MVVRNEQRNSSSSQKAQRVEPRSRSHNSETNNAMSAPSSLVSRSFGATKLLSRFWRRETNKGSNKIPSQDATPKLHNPFLPRYIEETGRWHPPRYSRRRQAELTKAARLTGVQNLLPPGPKFIPQSTSASSPTPLHRQFFEQPVEWIGEPRPFPEKPNGLYEGRRFVFKGHKWERKLPEREQALHNFKVKHDENRCGILPSRPSYDSLTPHLTRRVLHNRMKRLERKAEAKRQKAGILV